jgi:hypothetical protein
VRVCALLLLLLNPRQRRADGLANIDAVAYTAAAQR